MKMWRQTTLNESRIVLGRRLKCRVRVPQLTLHSFIEKREVIVSGKVNLKILAYEGKRSTHLT
ncbi:pas-domain protein [Thalassiosira pseudonana CCMP1335]